MCEQHSYDHGIAAEAAALWAKAKSGAEWVVEPAELSQADLNRASLLGKELWRISSASYPELSRIIGDNPDVTERALLDRPPL